MAPSYIEQEVPPAGGSFKSLRLIHLMGSKYDQR